MTIDNIQVEVPEGANVLEAAKKIGVVIPHFCYHPALGSVGACRLCAMKFVEGPVKGVQVSCMIKAADGMVVSTTDGEAARLRRMVIEWLMVNHPHDCPVCDEGGMCLLQDYTVSGGHGIRRYKGKKRVFADQYLGEFIQHEMNRCIQCYRCARFYQDYAGGDDFGPMQIANKVYFGRFREGWLESEFSGNLADVCPTGVLTDRTFRYKARLWDLETAPSVCPHCSLGCNVIPGARYRELLRVVARENKAVNGWFICDRGRFGYRFASRPDRPYRPMVKNEETTREAALKSAADMLFDVMEMHGPDAVAFLGSVRASVETDFALKKLADTLGSTNVCFNVDQAAAEREALAVSKLRGVHGRSPAEIAGSDVIAAVGVDPVNEAPMLALMMRQAFRNGAKVFVVDPRPVKLPMDFRHIPVPQWELGDGLPEEVEEALGGAKSPTIIAGTALDAPGIIDLAAGTAKRLKDSGADSGVFYAMSGPNAFGAALMSTGRDFTAVLDGIAKGRIKALVAVESDPLGHSPHGAAARDAFGKLDALIALDYLPTDTVKAAGVFVPALAYAEDDGVFVNCEGRAQAFARAYTAGLPINSMGPEAHPPREFFMDVPGGAAPSWKSLLELACMLGPECRFHDSVKGLRSEIADTHPELALIIALEPGSEGAVLAVPDNFEAPEPPGPSEEAGKGLLLAAVERTFGTEELSSYSDKTDLKAPEPCVTLNADDAARLGLGPGAKVEMTDGKTVMECGLGVSANQAGGTAFAPGLRSWPVREMSGKRIELKIRKG